MARLPISFLDVFAEAPLGGAVVGGADAVPDDAMAAFAARLPLSETSYARAREVVTKGSELGSPSRLSARVGEARLVVSGSVRVVGEGTIELPVAAA